MDSKIFNDMWETAFVLGVEFGFKEREKNNNLETAMANASVILNETNQKKVAARVRAAKIRLAAK